MCALFVRAGVSAVTTTQRNGQVTGVVTDTGETIACDYVVNAAGMWARQLAETSGVSLVNQVMHFGAIVQPKQTPQKEACFVVPFRLLAGCAK